MRVVDHVTPNPNMGRKSFFRQNIVLISPTSWYKNIRAICFTFSVVPDLRAATRMRPLFTDGPCQRLGFFHIDPLMFQAIRTFHNPLYGFCSPLLGQFSSFRSFRWLNLTSTCQHKPLGTWFWYQNLVEKPMSQITHILAAIDGFHRLNPSRSSHFWNSCHND